MLKTIKRWLKRVFWAGALVIAVFTTWLIGFGWSDLWVNTPAQFSLKQGSSLRSSARQLQAAGVLDSPWQFELLARLNGDASRVQAGNFEITGKLTPFALLLYPGEPSKWVSIR